MFTVSLSSAAPAGGVTVNYVSANSTATAGSDYTAVNSSITIPQGQTSGTITVNTADDSLDENAETFTVTISSPTKATLGSPTVGTATLNDNDPTPTINANNPTAVVEGTNLVFTLTLSAVS